MTAEEKKKAIKDVQSVLSHYANASAAYSQDIKDLSENYKKLDEAKKKEVDEFLKNYTSEFIKNKQQQAIEIAIEDSKTQTEEELAGIVDEEKALAETENLLPKNTPESSIDAINGQIEEGTDYVILGKTSSFITFAMSLAFTLSFTFTSTTEYAIELIIGADSTANSISFPSSK